MVSSRRTWQFWLLALGGLGFVWLHWANPPSLQAATNNTINNTIPLDFIRSADCTGEAVALSGAIHLLAQAQPGGSFVVHFNYQNVTGLGLTTGDPYRATAVDQLLLSTPFPPSLSITRNFRLISLNSSSNLLVTIVYRIMVDSDNNFTVLVDNTNLRCT